MVMKPQRLMSSDYSLIVKRYKRPKTVYRRAKLLWEWEILRRSKPLGIRLCGDGLKSEQAAKLAGEKALRELLEHLGREENTTQVPLTETR
jgi:hypothetical protein